MKTAEQWTDEIREDPGMCSDLVRLFEQIQADALREAAEICDKQEDTCPLDEYDDGYNSGVNDCKNALTQRAAQLESPTIERSKE